MPAFRDRLSDQEAADLISFSRGSWGNQGAPVTPSEVAKVRKLLRANGLKTTPQGTRPI
jgi:mono/diheme cytochrome c family protein